MVVLSPMKQSISINRADLRLETIWDQYSAQLLAFIRSRVADEYASEDLLQEVFLRIHLNLCCLRNLSKLESWVYQITRNAIIDHYRSRIDTLELHENLPAESDFQEEDAESVLAPSLKELIDELPEAYREALVLTEYQGLSQKELAQRVGISLPGAKSRVQRARHMIRDMLLNCCHFELDRRGRIIDYHALCCCCNPT